MKFRKPKKSDVILLVIIALLIIPQTRQPIQIAMHSVLSKFGLKIVKFKILKYLMLMV